MARSMIHLSIMPALKAKNEPSPAVQSQRPGAVPVRRHYKSRKGCFKCKQRRVKCSEELPSCRGCRRLGLDCLYPQPPRPVLSLSPSAPSHAPDSPLRLGDLRFFHHFLVTAYPALPLGLDHLWQTVAAMSHEYGFLAHAILALAAQHLTASTDADFSVQALDHRVAAISALNQALSAPCPTRHDADAKFATAIILTFQSSYMSDGMMDFLAMLRGWMVIQTTVVPSLGESIFCGITEETYVGSMKRLLGPGADPDPKADGELRRTLQDFTASLRLAAPLCRSTAELHYLATLERVARVSQSSAMDACLELVPLYAATNEMDADAFAHFTKPTNLAAQVLLAHFWMLTHVLQRHALGPARAYALRDDILFQWTTTNQPTTVTYHPFQRTMSTPTPSSPTTPSCTYHPPGPQGWVPPTACNAHYSFFPSWEWNLFFAIAFFLASLFHIAQGLAARRWFCATLVAAAVMEYACFMLRTLGAFDQQNGAYVAVGAVLFLLAPLWINAFVYMVVARLVHFLLPATEQKACGLSPRWLAKVFVVADAVAFVIQAAGGGMLAGEGGGETADMGRKLYMAGIGVQLGFVVAFVGVAAVHYLRLERLIRAGLWEAKCEVVLVRQLVWAILVVVVLIVIRIVFRFIEFSGGANASNPVLANEAYQLGLDGLPMLLALILLNMVHPTKVLKDPDSDFPRTWAKRWRRKDKSGNGTEFQELDESNLELSGWNQAEERSGSA
ncbi:protein RTM1 [Staphylotrichum tortipilum]|uniref:Protein RTM1 n=1 Tax=Staphylotrichum tortipilum TaxID=2831512 RepID=A0AAN6MEH0_9PEZI|nr:protein RTM1 [Staphylotrichum longicolle]